SGTAIAYASVVVLTRFTRLLLSAGRLMRNASGRTIKRYVRSRLKPSDSAASMVVLGTASTPDRKISTLKAPAKKDKDTIAHATLLTIGTTTPEASAAVTILPTPK